MPTTGEVKLESVLDAIKQLVTEIQSDRNDRQRLLDKIHELANHLLANTAAENKLVAVTERQAGLLGAQAKAIQDLPEVVETHGYALIADVRVLLTDVRTALQAHLDGDDKRMEEVRRMFVSIERAAALAANDAGDAKSAALQHAKADAEAAAHGGGSNLTSLARLVLGHKPSNGRLILVVILIVVASLATGGGVGSWFRSKISSDTLKFETTTHPR